MLGSGYQTQENQISLMKKIIGSFRLIHFIPVLAITIIVAILSYFSLDGIKPIGAFILTVLTAFFQEGFIGIQNDYLDKESDKLYNKRKTLVQGWLQPKTAFWLMIIFYIIFTGLSFGLGIYAVIGFWIVLVLQGINLLGMLYNFILKNTPFSLIPYIICFPLAPVYVWLTLGGFELIHLWYIPIILFAAIAGHLANELPDLENDQKFGRKNSVVIIGERNALIVCWICCVLALGNLILLFFLFEIFLWLFLTILCFSVLFLAIALLLLRNKKWKSHIVIFDLITVYLGIIIIGVIFVLNL